MKKCKKGWLALAIISTLTVITSGCSTQKAGGNNNGANIGQPVTLTWYHPGKKQPDDSVVFEKLNSQIKEKINATVKFEVIDTGAYNDKMNLVIASGETMDICFTSNWTNKFYPNVAKGAYLALDDMLEKNTPNLKSSLPDFVWNAGRVEGKIYAVPNYQVMYRQDTQVVPKALADKYSLKPEGIKKVQDLEPFLEKIKQNEPTLFPIQNFFPNFYYYEQIKPTQNAAIKKDEDGYKVYNWYETQEYKDFLKLKREWFKKGYIRSDAATVTNDQSDVDNGKYAISYNTSKPGGLEDMKFKYNKEFVEIPMDEPYLQADAGTSSLNAISRNSKNPVRALMLLELMNTDKEIYNLKCFGIEGVHYDKIAEDQIKIKEDSKYTPNASWQFGNQFNAYFTNSQKPGIWAETLQTNEKAKKSRLAGFVLNAELIKNELSQLATVEKEYGILGSGSVDIEPTYTEFMEKYKKVGCDKVIAEVQRQVDEWVKSKK